jgi:hypothetical protein
MEEFKFWEKDNNKKIKSLIKDEQTFKQLNQLFKSAFDCGYNTGYVEKEKEIAKKNWEEWNQK